MARTPAAANGGWPTPRHPAEPDPRNGHAGPHGQRPAQPVGYPQQGGYPGGQVAPQGYDPQAAYYYPQNGQAAAANPRQGLSSLDPSTRPSPDYPSYPSAQPGYGQPQQPATPAYRPAPAPYGAPSAGDPRQLPANYEQWQAGGPAQDPRGYDLGGYLPTNAPHPGGMPLHGEPGPHHDPLQSDWTPGLQLGYSEGGAIRDPYAGGGQMGYEPVHGGALEQTYGQDEGADYDVDEPRRGSWALRIAGAIVVAIGLGYGLAQGYKLVAGSKPDAATPVVRGDSAPSKTLPAEPGGRQFDHADAKIMGRLGDGSSSATASSDSDVDANGARKVQTLVVGRDGSITPPSPPDQPVTTGAVAVPGLTVIDGFGGGYPQPAQAPASASSEAPAPPAAARKPVVVKPPASESKPVEVARVAPANTTETPAKAAAAAPKAPAAPKKAAAVTKPSSGANGYVVVLASVPASSSSRLSALKKFADMQGKYGAVLQNKTPDVQEANLGARGTYHRLLVGPPASRAAASTLCKDLKAAGYKDCWVMAY